MNTQNKIKLLSSLSLIVLITIFTTLLFFFNQRETDINEAYNINKARMYTSSILNNINEDYPDIDSEEIANQLESLNISALIADLENNILYNDTTFTTDLVLHELYLDQSYSNINEDLIKVTFPIEKNNVMIGLVIFEIPKTVLGSNNYTFYIIAFIVEFLVFVSLISMIIVTYHKAVIIPSRKLDKALLNISNGIYKKLSSKKPEEIKIFSHYNKMLDEIENMINKQAFDAKSRKQLIANISHEIRTPLSYVKMSAEILSKDNVISDENKKYIDTILKKITSIDAIIEDLFRYSIQDMDKLLVELNEVYAFDMFDRIFSNIKSQDNLGNIKLNFNNNIPNIILSFDENRIVQVVSNMVDNARKHIQNDGEINITTEIEENHLILIIEDSGAGIEPKDLPYIFEPFYQGSQDEVTKQKGAGLGLAICDYIIKKHHGEIYVYSEKGKGTRFVVKFPEII